MFHPLILKRYHFFRIDQQINAIDACSDTANGYGIPVAALAQCLITLRVAVFADAAALTLIA